MERRKKNSIKRFLLGSGSALIIFSIFTFIFLASYMTTKSHDAFHQIGTLYMSGVSEQISRHFESVINLRFNQVIGLTAAVSSDISDQEEIYKKLIDEAYIRNFDYLALCSSDGRFETLSGKSIYPLNPMPFIDSLQQGKQRVAIGVDSDGNEVVLFGVDADYPMLDGSKSTGLIAAVPLEYITYFLCLDEEVQSMNYCIVRNDGSFVIDNPNIGFSDNSEYLPELLTSYRDDKDLGYSAEAFAASLKNRESYSSSVEINGAEKKLYSIPLANSEWNLIAIMSYNQLNGVLDTLNVQRTRITVLCCAAVLVFMLLLFSRYLYMANQQLLELEESRQKTIEASKAKSEFLANMSHDIRTPMNAIVGMTAIAIAHMDDMEQVKGCLKKISLSSKQLLGLINDVLDMSKIESGKMTLSEGNTSLKDLFDGIVSIMQPLLNAKKQNFDVHVTNVITENVWCDGVRLNQVLLNLLSNATKYTQEEGTIRLSIFEEKSTKGEDYARIHISVEDNGIGMEPEFLEKIFESYSRVDNTRTQKIEGTGLGMTITKYIVDFMGGTIDVQSELDKGTKINLIFDFKKAPAGEVEMVLPPWNILVVDDDEFLCKSTIDTLKSFGINAESTMSGEKAVEMVIRHHRGGDDYQIILLDWKLPDINGIEVAKRIRDCLGNAVPILLISAYDWSEFEAEALEAGINGFIPKPLFKSTLFYNLRKYMGIEDDCETEDLDINMSGHRILLAEDNELNWEVAKELLSDIGLELDWAENGQMCVEKFEKSPAGYYDAILMDIRMPFMTGYEATQVIRKLNHPDALSVPIIAMSADAFSEDVQRCLECGMNAHIAKPIDIVELTRLLKKYM